MNPSARWMRSPAIRWVLNCCVSGRLVKRLCSWSLIRSQKQSSWPTGQLSSLPAPDRSAWTPRFTWNVRAKTACATRVSSVTCPAPFKPPSRRDKYDKHMQLFNSNRSSTIGKPIWQRSRRKKFINPTAMGSCPLRM